MIKRLTVAVAALFALAAPVFAAGTVPGFSLTPQFDLTGAIAPGCHLYVIQAGTVSTPQQPYQDSGLTILAQNPLTCDAAGRLPQWFVADGTIKLRLTKSNGTQIFVGDGLLVVGASSGGGGGSPVDATTVLATGDTKARYGVGVLTGFVRANGRTIGSATSGATERANADTQSLFEYLWGADANLSVSGGRGATANADWSANKTLTLPDLRGRTIAGLDDMGSSSASIITGTTCSAPTTLGTKCGTETKLIGQTNFPNFNFNLATLAISNTLGLSNTLAIQDLGHTHQSQDAQSKIGTFTGGGSNGWAGTTTSTTSSSNSNTSLTGTVSLTGTISLTGAVGLTGLLNSGGSGTPFGVLTPVMLMTVYIKL